MFPLIIKRTHTDFLNAQLWKNNPQVVWGHLPRWGQPLAGRDGNLCCAASVHRSEPQDGDRPVARLTGSVFDSKHNI